MAFLSKPELSDSRYCHNPIHIKKASIGKPFLLPGERKTDCLTLAIRNLYIRNLVSLQLDYPDRINRDRCMQVVIIHFLVIITFVRIGSIVPAVMLEVKFQFA